MKQIACGVALTVLCLVGVRQSHEVKNAAYDAARLLDEIDNYESLRLSLSAACRREGSPSLLVERAEHMRLALVHPFELPSRAGRRTQNVPRDAAPKRPVAVAASPERSRDNDRYLSLARR